MLRFSKLLLVAALAISVGLHWALLQSVAWVGMVVNYAQSAPLGEALSKTFDGQHPCKICKVVKEGKKSEQQQEFQKSASKIDFFLAQSLAKIFPPVFAPSRAPMCVEMSALIFSPPVPPPRTA